MLRGVPVDRVSAADVRAALGTPEGEAALAALSPTDAEALTQRVRDLLAAVGRDVALARDERDRVELMADVVRDARRLGQVDGLREALSAGVGERRPRAHVEADVPWSSLTDRFLSSRPGLSPSSRVSYAQAFRDCKDVVGDKHLSEITARDIAKYSEYLEQKVSKRGSSGILNRKTIIRMTGHIRTFTSWAQSAGLIPDDPGAQVKVRHLTKQEQKDREEGTKRGFTSVELERLFDSPLYTGCASRARRTISGQNIYRDAKWWFLVVAHLTGARCEELAEAPSILVDLNGVVCVDLRHGSKTLAAPRVVPVSRSLAAVGFLEYAYQQSLSGKKLFSGNGAILDWSKWTNRYIDSVLGSDPTVSFHSFRHSFRQSCSAAQLGDYLCDKILGHRSKKDRSEGSVYGRDLSSDEARLVVEKLNGPVSLAHLKPPLVRPRFPLASRA
jgi:integrase